MIIFHTESGCVGFSQLTSAKYTNQSKIFAWAPACQEAAKTNTWRLLVCLYFVCNACQGCFSASGAPLTPIGACLSVARFGVLSCAGAQQLRLPPEPGAEATVFVESSSSESSVVVDSEPDEDERAEQERLKPGAPVVPVLSVAKSHFTFAPSNLKAPGVSVLDKQLALAVSAELGVTVPRVQALVRLFRLCDKARKGLAPLSAVHKVLRIKSSRFSEAALTCLLCEDADLSLRALSLPEFIATLHNIATWDDTAIIRFLFAMFDPTAVGKISKVRAILLPLSILN